MLTGSLLAADEAAREDDTRYGEICCSKGGHYHPVSEYIRAKILASAGKHETDGERGKTCQTASSGYRRNKQPMASTGKHANW